MPEILLRERDFLVVRKPPFMPTEKDAGGAGDLLSATASVLREAGERDTLYLVHRLDRVVGGLVVLARNRDGAAALSEMIARREMTKEYFAVAAGELPEHGVLRDYLMRDGAKGKAFASDRPRAGFKEAQLSYRTLAKCEGSSLLLVRLATGRFHQIRCQFATRQHPLLGDGKYGNHDNRCAVALYAAHIGFTYRGKKTDIWDYPDLSAYPWARFDRAIYENAHFEEGTL